jgi:hypothetical protein
VSYSAARVARSRRLLALAMQPLAMTRMSNRNDCASDAGLAAGRRGSPRASMTMTWRRLLRDFGHRWLLENDRHALPDGIVSVADVGHISRHGGLTGDPRWWMGKNRPRQIMTPCLQGIKLS